MKANLINAIKEIKNDEYGKNILESINDGIRVKNAMGKSKAISAKHYGEKVTVLIGNDTYAMKDIGSLSSNLSFVMKKLYFGKKRGVIATFYTQEFKTTIEVPLDNCERVFEDFWIAMVEQLSSLSEIIIGKNQNRESQNKRTADEKGNKFEFYKNNPNYGAW